MVLDAARADHFGCYGYPRDTTPNIDRLAAESILFEQHFCDFPRTLPSTASLFTGNYADTHGIGHGIGQRNEWTAAGGDMYVTRQSWTLLRELHKAGYQTALFASHRLIGRPLEETGLFDTAEGYRAPPGGGVGKAMRDPLRLVSSISSWLDKRPASPFLVYVHFTPPHSPYQAPDEILRLFAGQTPPTAWQGDYPFREIKRQDEVGGVGPLPPLKEWVNKYDASLRWSDSGVGQLEKVLRQKKLLDKTILIVTADHGEAFGEHGYVYHVCGVYDELLHIPLVMRLPKGYARGRVQALTQTVDITPTLLDLLGMDATGSSIQGRSLLPLISGDDDRVRDYVFALSGGAPRSYLVRDQDWALILYEGGKLRALYDLRTDPKQLRNLIGAQPKVTARMTRAFRAFAMTQRAEPLQFVDPAFKPRPLPAQQGKPLTDEMRRDLKALGYLK